MNTKFSSRLRELLRENAISKRALSEKIGVSATSISDWTNGNVLPNAESVYLIADFFQVTTDYLLGRSDDFGTVTLQNRSTTLSAEEHQLVKRYRELDKSRQELLFELLDTWQNC